MSELILASASPRRQRLLRWLGLGFDVAVSSVEDDIGSSNPASPTRLAEEIALAKAQDVAARRPTVNALVLGFDTLVVCCGQTMGKPVDISDAGRMLHVLSGREHTVVTGAAAVDVTSGRTESFAHETPVLMKKLSGDDLARWLSGDEALGCAGAYNIERHLAEVAPDECFQNVAGLPLCHLYVLLADRFGLSPMRPNAHCNAARGVRCLMAPALLGHNRLE